jgi:hypothetical protein
MSSTAEEPTGPPNPHAGADLPAPPGGPQRSDAPAGSTSPGGPETEPQPEVHPSSTPDGPQVVPAPAEPEPGPDRPERSAEQQLQEENAATSLDQPSGGN